MAENILYRALVLKVCSGETVLSRLGELGVACVLLEDPAHCEANAPQLRAVGLIQGAVSYYSDRHKLLDERKTVEAALEAVVDYERQTGFAFDCILNFSEEHVIFAADLAELLMRGRFPNASAVRDARDKHRMRQFLEKRGFPMPKNAIISSTLDLESLLISPPLVLKPAKGSDSSCVLKILDSAQLRESWETLRLAHASDEVSFGGSTAFVVEEFVAGACYSVDLVMQDGTLAFFGAIEHGPTRDPWFFKTWAVCPPLLSDEKLRLLGDYSAKVLLHLGLSHGVFNVEAIWSERVDAPMLVEVNCRMAGGFCSEMERAVTGVDLVEATLRSALAQPLSAPREPLAHFAASLKIYSEPTAVPTLNEPEACRLAKAILDDEVGTGRLANFACYLPITGLADCKLPRVATLLAFAPSREEALDRLSAAFARLSEALRGIYPSLELF